MTLFVEDGIFVVEHYRQRLLLITFDIQQCIKSVLATWCFCIALVPHQCHMRSLLIVKVIVCWIVFTVGCFSGLLGICWIFRIFGAFDVLFFSVSHPFSVM